MERQNLILQTLRLLDSEGFRISSFEDVNSCFDILAKRKNTALAIKVLANIDSLREEQARELIKFGNAFGANVLVLGERTKTYGLEDDHIYERYGIATITLKTLKNSIRGEGISIKHFKGRDIVELDSERMRKCRENYGLSLQEVGEKLNLTKESVHRFETKSVSSLENAKRLEKLFNCNLIKKIDLISGRMETKITDERFFPDPVLGKMHDLGFKISLFEHAPLRAVGSERRELLIEQGREKKEIERKAEQLGKIKSTIESEAVIFSRDLKGKKVDDVAIISEAEVKEMHRPKELLKLIKERENEK